VAKEVKIYGITFTAFHEATMRLTWDRVISGLEAVLRSSDSAKLLYEIS
jgi:hypothetical protein